MRPLDFEDAIPMMKSTVSICPVPEEQQPINEYQELAESWFFRWALQSWPGYLKPMLWIWGLSWLVVGPITSYSFAPSRQPVLFALCGIAGASVVLLLPLLYLYVGWVHVRDRLRQAAVPYEESGWYDGQTWEKPPEVLIRDRLIVTHEIQPQLRRLLLTFVATGAVIAGSIAGILIWQKF